MGMFSSSKPRISDPPPPPPAPAKVDAPDAAAVQNAKDRADLEKSRRGRSKLRIPLGGTGGGSGVSIPM